DRVEVLRIRGLVVAARRQPHGLVLVDPPRQRPARILGPASWAGEVIEAFADRGVERPPQVELALDEEARITQRGARDPPPDRSAGLVVGAVGRKRTHDLRVAVPQRRSPRELRAIGGRPLELDVALRVALGLDRAEGSIAPMAVEALGRDHAAPGDVTRD